MIIKYHIIAPTVVFPCDKLRNKKYHTFKRLWSVCVSDHTPYHYPIWRLRPGVGDAHPAACVVSALVHDHVGT